MALARRGGQRFNSNIWPGFVDAMTALLLVLMFVLSIFMVVQAILSETISDQDDELSTLTRQLSDLSAALSFVESRNTELEGEVGQLSAALADARSFAQAQAGIIATLEARAEESDAQIASQIERLTSFEEQVALLLSQQEDLQGQLTVSGDALSDAIEERDALNLALIAARSEIDDKVEAARRAAAEREALEALIADLRSNAAESETSLAGLLAQLDERAAENDVLAGELAALREEIDEE